MSKILPLLSFHDAELTKPIIDDIIDGGSYDVGIGYKKIIYAYNHNKHYAASLTPNNGNSTIIPPFGVAEITLIHNPVPFDEERFMAEGYTEAIELEPEEPIHKIGYNVYWLKQDLMK